jgi:Ca2+/H+ antiporter
MTTFTAPILYLPATSVWLVHGILSIVAFAVYTLSVGWAISRGDLTAPEGSDSDSSDESNGSSSTESTEEDTANANSARRRHNAVSDSHNIIESPHIDFNTWSRPSGAVSSTTPLLSHQIRSKHKTVRYHVTCLLLGFLGICLAGYVLSHAASTISDEFMISDLLFGIVVLSIATTLPEKFVAVMSSHRGRAGVFVANTAGSNIFLLTLCSGIVMLVSKGSFPHGDVGLLELGVLWGSTAAFTATVWFGERFCRWIGSVMLIVYIIFVVFEFM